MTDVRAARLTLATLQRPVASRHLVAGAVALFAVLSLSVSQVAGPIVLPDELGYLGIGRWLAGEGLNPATHYDPGLGYLLAPVFALTSSADAAYRGAVLLNVAMLAGALPLLARGLQGRRTELLLGDVAAAGALVMLPFAWWVHVAMPTPALALLTSLAFWALRRQPSSPALWTAFTAVGWSLAMHTRGIVLVLATLIALLLSVWRSRGRPELAGHLGSVVALGAGTGVAVATLRRGLAPAGQTSSISHEATQLEAAPDRLGDLLVHAWTNASHEVLASAALVVVGVVLTARQLRRPSTADPGDVFALALLALSLAATAIRTNGASTGPIGLRFLFMGRYLAPFALPLVALGLQHLLLARQPVPGMRRWVGLASVAAAVAILLVPRSRGLQGEVWSTFDSQAIGLFAAATRSTTLGLSLAGAAAVAAGVVLILALPSTTWRPRLGVLHLLASVLLVPVAMVPTFDASEVSSIDAVRPTTRLVESLVPAGACVLIDVASFADDGGETGTAHQLRWTLPWSRPATADLGCGWAVSRDDNFGDGEWVRVGSEGRDLVLRAR